MIRPATLVLCALALPTLLGMAPAGRAAAPTELWIFFSPRDGEFTKMLSEVQDLARKEPGVRLRPVLLVDDSGLLKKPSESLAQNVKGLRALIGEEFGLRVWDDEGLAAARALGLERLPALVRLERDGAGKPGKAHVAYGTGANLKELCRCGK